MDMQQLMTVIDYMVGGRSVGGTVDEPLETPHSPELRAFIVGRLGELTPAYGSQVVMFSKYRVNPETIKKSKAFAAFLREIADGIDPPENV
jgi:hypothetical protein